MPVDDAGIPDDADLWRRIPPEQMTRDDGAPGGRRPSSGNFDDPELSVVIAAECQGGIETLLRGLDCFGVATVTVRDVRRLGLGIIRVHEEGLPGHAVVTGRKTGSKSRALARACRMIRDPVPRGLN